MQLTKVAHQLRPQLHQLPGICSPHFSIPQAAFIEEMLSSLNPSQDCKLSAIRRALDKPITLQKTAERLTHHLAAPHSVRHGPNRSWHAPRGAFTPTP